MVALALIGILPVNLDRARDELNVRNVGLVRLINVTHDELLHLDSLLLAFVLLVTVKFGCGVLLVLLASLRDDMLIGSHIPRDQLSVDATTDEHLGVLRRKLDCRDLNRRLKGELSENDLAVAEVQDQDL